MTQDILQNIKKSGWDFPAELWPLLSDYEKSFAEIELTGLRSFDYFVRRLDAIGFSDMDHILDAACGIGQWSAAMASKNKNVTGVDMMMNRLIMSRAMCEAMGFNNTSFSNSYLEDLEFAPDSFDGVFCYGAFMFTDMPKVADHFKEMLKTGGKLYVNANAPGWYAHLLLDRGLKKADPKIMLSALRMIVRTAFGCRKHIVVRESWLIKLLEERGFRIIASGPEGMINISASDNKLEPAYPPSYYGMPGVIEILAEKM